MSGGSWVQSPVWPSFLFNRLCIVQKVATKVLVALRLCIQSRSKGFGGSASVHTNQAVDFWCVTHKLQRV